MGLIKPSLNITTYLISLSAPQSVDITASRLQGLLKNKGCTLSPIPPGIPILQLRKEPGEPVPGILPICNEPLKMNQRLISERSNRDSAEESWIIWPMESTRWLSDLFGALEDFYSENSICSPDELLFPGHRGIPLAVSNKNGRGVLNIFDESDSTPVTIPGWRALVLVCWKVESPGTYPWYKAVVWTPLWHRRLRRAPKMTNSNKVN